MLKLKPSIILKSSSSSKPSSLLPPPQQQLFITPSRHHQPPQQQHLFTMQSNQQCHFGSSPSSSDQIINHNINASSSPVLSIKQSPNDKRQYGHITLDNGISAIVISDRTTKESSCSMNVRVGYFNDPVDRPGLAHFCEHMLFLGTSVYPTEGEYKRYLSHYGGSSNASTSSEYTNYYFSVNNEGFHGGIDRFAQFFICPLFTESGTSREVNAVDSEFRRNLQTDSRRSLQLLKCFVNPVHPFSKFSTGNLSTLLSRSHNGSAVESAEENELRSRVIRLYEDTYSADCMKLVCYGAESVDELKKMVSEKFCGVKRLENRSLAQNLNEPLFLVGNEGENGDCSLLSPTCKMVHLVPVKDLKQVILYWELPSQYPIYRNKVNFYLNYLLEHQGTGSLYQLLKGKGLINSISAGVYTESSAFSLYRIAIDLTSEGLNQIDTILRHFYQYLQLIKRDTILNDSSQLGYEIFDEVRRLHEQSFAWLEKISPSTYTSRISKRMQEYPIEDCLYAPYHFGQFDPDLVVQHLDLLTPARMHVQIVSRIFNEDAQLQEPIYGTKYFVRDMPQDLFERLSNTTKISKHLSIPGRNSFIAEDFTIKTEQTEFAKLHKLLEDIESNAVLPDLEPPQLITSEQSKHRVWYKPHSHFSMPLAHVYSMIRISGDVIQNIRGALLLRVFISMVYESLSDVSYDAEMADLSFEIHSETGEGLEIFCGGFNHKLDKLIGMLYERIVNPEFNQIVFDRVKNLYVRKYSNHSKDQANEQSKYLVNMVTQEPFFAYNRYLKMVEKLEMVDVIQFFNQAIRDSPEFKIDTFINGNMTKEQCITISNQMDSLLKHKELPEEEQAVSFVFQLPRGQVTLIERPSSNNHDANCSVNVHFQLGTRDLVSKVKLDLLAKIMKSYFFDSLRTKQQCGYSVHTRPIYYQCSLAFQLYVQSPSHHPRDVYMRIKRFINEEFVHILNHELDNDAFDRYKDSLIKTKQKPHTKLLEESFNYWTEIYYRRYHWEKLKDEVEELAKITKDELIELYNKHFIDRAERQELAVLVYGTAFPVIAKPNNEQASTKKSEEQFLDIIGSDGSDNFFHVGDSDQAIEQFKRCHMTSRYPVNRNSFATYKH